MRVYESLTCLIATIDLIVPIDSNVTAIVTTIPLSHCLFRRLVDRKIVFIYLFHAIVHAGTERV